MPWDFQPFKITRLLPFHLFGGIGFLLQLVLCSPAFSDLDSARLASHGLEESKDSEVAELSLEGLIEFAKKNSPSYLAAKQGPLVAQGDLTSAGLLPNPQLAYSTTFIGGNPSMQGGSQEHAPGVQFELDLFGKRGGRVEVAERYLRAEEFSVQDFERRFKFEIKQTYRELLFLKSQLKSKKEFLGTYLDLVRASQVRADKGDISGVEFDRLDLERIAYESEFLSLELRVIEVSQRMRILLGIPAVPQILALAGELKFTPLDQLGLRLSGLDFERRPDFAALQAKVSGAKALVSLKAREAFPTLQLGGEFRMKAQEGTFGLSLSFPIPILNRNQGEVAKAEETSKKLKFELEGKHLEIHSEVLLKLNEVRSREKLLKGYEELGLLNRNRTVAERSRFAYLKRAYSIVALLESQRNYVNVNWNYFEQLYLYYVAFDRLMSTLEGMN